VRVFRSQRYTIPLIIINSNQLQMTFMRSAMLDRVWISILRFLLVNVMKDTLYSILIFIETYVISISNYF
jgi:hypothetical protein